MPGSRHTRPSPPRARWRVILAAAAALVLASGVGTWAVMSTAQSAPLPPPVSTIAPPTPTPVAPPVVAPTTTMASPAPPPEPQRTTPRRTVPRTVSPPSWTDDKLREAERRLRQLNSGGPNSSLRKCLESGKLYEQCTG